MLALPVEPPIMPVMALIIGCIAGVAPWYILENPVCMLVT